MATASLMDYLAGDALTKLAQAYAVKPGLPRPLPPPFYTPGASKPYGTAVKYDLVNGSRESAKVTNPDSPSQAAQGITTETREVVAISTREHYLVKLDMIQALQHPGDLVRMNAQTELQRQVKGFVDRFMNLRTNTVHSAIFRGIIDVSSTGEIQTSTSSPNRTLTMTGVSATQLTTAGAGSTYAIGDWNSASANIITNIKGLKKLVAKSYGFQLTDAYYGVNVPEYLAKNTVFKEYLARFPQFRDSFSSTGEIPDGVLGLKWTPVDVATTVSSGSATSWTSDDFIGFSPDPSDTGWYEFYECGMLCPTGMASEAEMKQAMLTPDALSAAFQTKYGIRSWSVFDANTISAKIVVADDMLSVVKSPNVFCRGLCH